MRVDEGESRFMHAFHVDDGIFCMRVEDFLDYFTSIIAVRDFDRKVHGYEYEQPWKLQKSFLATRTKEIMQDQQFIFTQEDTHNPTPVKVTAILTQQDPRLNQSYGAPYSDQRANIGLLVMGMGKSINVRENEKVANYDPNKEIVQRATRPFRTIVVQFGVLPGKYSVIPLVQNLSDPGQSRYTLRLYFNAP